MRKLLLFFISIAAFGMSLKEATQTALQKSPLLVQAKLDEQEAKLNKKAARAKNFGQLFLNASYTHYNIPRTLEPLVPPLTSPVVVSKDITNAALSYRVTIFNGFADISEIKLSELGQKMSALKKRLTAAQLLYNVKSLYFSALELKVRSQAMRSYIEALKELARKTELEVELGKKAKLDLLRVQNELEGAKAKLTTLQTQLATLKAALAATIGIDAIDEIQDAKESLQEQKEQLALKIARLNIDKSHKSYTKTKARYYPKLELIGSYAKNYAQSTEAELWQGGVSLSYTLFDFGLRSAQTQKAKLQELKAKSQLLQTKLSHQANLTKAKEQIKDAKAAITHLTTQLQLRRQIAYAEKIRYETGASDMSDYLKALAALHQARADLKAGYYKLYKAYAYYNFIQRSGS